MYGQFSKKTGKDHKGHFVDAFPFIDEEAETQREQGIYTGSSEH